MDAVVTAASAVATLDGAVDEIALLEAELAELRARYEQEPRNYELADLVGRKQNRLFSMRRSHAPKEPPPAYKRVAPISTDEFMAAIPDTCPGCGGSTARGGYICRVGSHGWRCTRGQGCNYHGRLEER